MWTLQDAAPTGMTMFDYPASAGQVVSGAFDEALETNPVPLFMMARELHGAKSIGPRLDKADAEAEAERRGVKIKIPEEGITKPALDILTSRKQDEAARSMLYARREGFLAGAGMFSAGVAGSLMDPLNAAAGFIPVLSGTRYAAGLAKSATMGSRAAFRLGIGGAEGVVGAAAVELPTMALRRDLQDEYGLYDSMANIAFGTFASMGLRAGTGALRDKWRGIQAARQEDFLRSVEPEQWAAQRRAYEEQIQRGMDQELRQGFDVSEGPSEGLRQRWEREREIANKLPDTDDDITPEILQKILGRLPVEARTDAGARGLFKRLISLMANEKGILLFHESPGDVSDSMLKHGIRSDLAADGKGENIGTFAAVGEPSNYVGGKKTIVQFRVPRNRMGDLVPDMQYWTLDKLSPHQILLLSHPEVKGAYVAFNETIPKKWIEKVEVIDPAALVSDQTHAQALKTAVAQAAEGQRINVDPVLRQDPVYGSERMPLAEVRQIAESANAPENKSAASPEASARADAALKAEAPAAELGRAEPPPPRGTPGEAAGAEAQKDPELAALEKSLSDAKKDLDAAMKAQGIEPPKAKEGEKDPMQRAQDYEAAMQSLAACVKGKG